MEEYANDDQKKAKSTAPAFNTLMQSPLQSLALSTKSAPPACGGDAFPKPREGPEEDEDLHKESLVLG